MTEPLASKKSLALIENFRSPDGVRAHVFKSNLGGDAIVIIEADTAGGDEAEVTLNYHEVATLHDWLGRALGLSAAPPSPQSPIEPVASNERSLLTEARGVLRSIRDEFRDHGTISGRVQREGENIIDRIGAYLQSPPETPTPQSPIEPVASKERVFRLPAAQELLEARQEIELLRAEVEKYKAWAASCEPAPDSVRAAFKNFHRLLCERFNYLHDEKDWERDQLSLIEWIAERELKAMRTAAETPTPQSPIAAKASQSITINGFQARMLMKFADAEDDCYMEVANLPARKSIDGEDMEAGLYVWLSEYPEEGCLLLTEKPTEQGFCSESAKASAAEPRELSASEAASFGKAFASSPRRLAANAKAQQLRWKNGAPYGSDGVLLNYDEVAALLRAHEKAPAAEAKLPHCASCTCITWTKRDLPGGGIEFTAPPPGELRAEQEETVTPCEHLRSELLAEKQVAGEPLFQMRKCLDCKLIFRVRSSLPANHDGPDDETNHAGRDAE